MRTATTHLTAPLIVFSALMTCASLSAAQTSAAAKATVALDATSATSASTNQPASKANQLIERITVEDAGSRIDEVRFGGQTRSITVQPKGGMPAYDIQPETGARTWKIFGY
jgi:streptogramin lyase